MIKQIISLTSVIVFIIGAVVLIGYRGEKAGPVPSHKDATYSIVGKKVTLKNGVAESEDSQGSASKIITRYFGNEVINDFDGDGREDVAFLLTQETGGSGTFFYAVAAFNTENGYIGTEAVLIGDRIAPQTTEIINGLLIVNYADRAPGEGMTAMPSVGKSIWLKLDLKTLQFGEVVQNFEGEIDPNRLSLTMKKYVSSEFGIEFFYPKNYYLESKDLGTANRKHFQVSLTDDTEENRAVREGRAPGREGPVAITFDFYQNPEGTAPLAWVKGNNNSNYKLSVGTYKEIMLAGQGAVAYSFSGLYEADAVAFPSQDFMVLASVTYLNQSDQIRTDFSNLLKTINLR